MKVSRLIQKDNDEYICVWDNCAGIISEQFNFVRLNFSTSSI